MPAIIFYIIKNESFRFYENSIWSIVKYALNPHVLENLKSWSRNAVKYADFLKPMGRNRRGGPPAFR